MSKPDKKIRLIVHGSLNDFLDKGLSDPTRLTISFELSPSVKDLMESKGIPHTAVFRVLVNGAPESADYNVVPDDEIEVFPMEEVDPDELETIFSSPPAFIADSHLAKLGRDLRLLGIDTLINEDKEDAEIIRLSNNEKRMILTRNLNLLRHGSTQYGYWVRSEDPDQQLDEVLSRFDLFEMIQPFSRCMACNGMLDEVSPEEVREEVPPKVREWCDQYHRCKDCGKVYWKGSHYDKLKEKVERVINKMQRQG